MTFNELREMENEEIIEVNGIELGFQVSMLSSRKCKKIQEEYLLESYYDFLNQSKKNGFMTQYIEMSVNKALCIFEDVDGLGTHCFRKVQGVQ